MSKQTFMPDEAASILPLRAEALGDNSHVNQAADVSLVSVAKSFGPRAVLRDIDLFIGRQEFVALVGRSGCGKSTLLRLIAGLISPSSGRVYVDGTILSGVNPRARMMFQDARLLPWLRVADNVALATADKNPIGVQQALESVQLAERARDWPATLSGGQRQRVALARALIGRPPLLLLDEPLGALDALTRIEMQQLIYSLWEQHPCTTVLVTHDIEEAVTLADRVIILEHGTIRDEFPVDLPRPRDRANARFQQLSTRVLERVLRPSSVESYLNPPHLPRALPAKPDR
ncbi:MAG TPA: ATP-binding cassette domain-containing protein [Pirellulales bacterium]|nr:ATP-binding cassette domain-containing protein [Pirellulales bacterium]